jgi:phosphatidylglycerophosphate synthase
MDTPHDVGARRDVATRRARWAVRVAAWLARAGVRPNTISAASVGAAVGAGICVAAAPAAESWRRPAWLIAAALLIQLRLLCNLFDGMVAVEGGLKTKSGEIFNDLPDRIADPAILLGAGYALSGSRFGVELGWCAALLAVLTAYIRVLGGAAGAQQYFLGPMAKQQRMAVLTVALLAGIVVPGHLQEVLAATLAVVSLGCIVTAARRVCAIVRELEAK